MLLAKHQAFAKTLGTGLIRVLYCMHSLPTSLHSCPRHLGPQVSGGKKAGQRVTDEHQLVRRDDKTLAPGHEDARRLVSLYAAEEHVDGVRQAGEVSEALR